MSAVLGIFINNIRVFVMFIRIAAVSERPKEPG